jgi:hypothetical protein
MTPPSGLPDDLKAVLHDYETLLAEFETASTELTQTIREGRAPSRELLDREESLRARLVEARRKTWERWGL